MKKIPLVSTFILTALLFPQLAQAGSGTITVTAVDQNGKPLSGLSFQCSDVRPKGKDELLFPAPNHSTLVTNAQGMFTWSIPEVDSHKLSCFPKDGGKCNIPSRESSISNVTMSTGEQKSFTYKFTKDPNCAGGTGSGTAPTTTRTPTAVPTTTVQTSPTLTPMITQVIGGPYPTRRSPIIDTATSLWEKIYRFFNNLFN